jgi:hypothetical protein
VTTNNNAGEPAPPPEVPQMEPENGAKTGKGHHPNSRKNLRPSGPGRSHGSRNKFSKEAIARFVDQYRADLAADWNKHGAAFVEKCREMLPQIYATMQRMRIEDELARAPADSGPIQVTWLQTDQAEQAPPVAPAPPLQITYQKPELPAGLSERDWSVLVSLLETVKRTIPSNSDDPPELVFGIMRDALLKHYAQDEPIKPKTLPPRGKSGRFN